MGQKPSVYKKEQSILETPLSSLVLLNIRVIFCSNSLDLSYNNKERTFLF